MFKIQRPIYYVNADSFQDQLYKSYGRLPQEDKAESSLAKMELNASITNRNSLIANDEDHLKAFPVTSDSPFGSPTKRPTPAELTAKHPDIILDFSAVNYIDTSGVKILQQIIDDFKKMNVFVYICSPQGNSESCRLFFPSKFSIKTLTRPFGIIFYLR